MTSTYPIAYASNNDALSSYRQETKKIPLITKEREVELVNKLIDNQDISAAKELVISHLRFVVYLADKYKNYGLEVHDLIQEGNIGLMKAVKRFSPTFNVRLASFAVHYIKSEMREFILRNMSISRLATTKAQRKIFFNSSKLKTESESLTPDEITLIANELDVPEFEVITMESRLISRDKSLNAPSNFESNEDKIHMVPDKSEDLETNLINYRVEKVKSDKLQFAIDKLDDRSKHILLSRYQDNKIKLTELAVHYSISAERVRQIERNAINTIKKEIGDAL